MLEVKGEPKTTPYLAYGNEVVEVRCETNQSNSLAQDCYMSNDFQLGFKMLQLFPCNFLVAENSDTEDCKFHC